VYRACTAESAPRFTSLAKDFGPFEEKREISGAVTYRDESCAQFTKEELRAFVQQKRLEQL
jgi:hypothetical protein